MKVKVINTEYLKEFESRFGTRYSFQIEYEFNGETNRAFYNSTEKNQSKFVKGNEIEVTIEEKTSEKGRDYLVIKPASNKPVSNFNRKLKQEQSKYSGFAMSYAKDLCVAGKIQLKDLETYTRKMFSLMVELDKSMES